MVIVMFALFLLKASGQGETPKRVYSLNWEEPKTQPHSPSNTPSLTPQSQSIEKSLFPELKEEETKKNLETSYSWKEVMMSLIFLPNTVAEFLSELGKGF